MQQPQNLSEFNQAKAELATLERDMRDQKEAELKRLEKKLSTLKGRVTTVETRIEKLKAELSA